MLGGLVHQTEGGPEVNGKYMVTDASIGGNSQASVTMTGGTETTASVTSMEGSASGALNSHLDSFFQNHAMTREDVLVVAAVVQLVAWSALLYLEVSDR